MNIEKLENDIQLLVTNLNKTTFIYDLLRTYGQPKASITRLQKGDYNLAKLSGDILWKKKLYFRAETIADLHSLIDTVKSEPTISKQQPRFLIVTDFETLLAIDSKNGDTLDIPFPDLARHYDFFLPWAGMEKTHLQNETLADIKAAERMGQLYDIIRANNPAQSEEERHAFNIFLSRLLFCFFAEDTGIFDDGQFTNAVASHTAEDGGDLQTYLQRLFKILNLRERDGYPQFLQAFPYANGGLFADESPVPKFSAKARKIIIESGSLNWKQINPDIFGSMMQAVVHDDMRGSLGMHYTSVVNIMKVIQPLFLDDLYDALERAGNSKPKLEALLGRLQRLRIFDPACGSGNFLIIVFKELCKLEIEIFKRLQGTQLSFRFTQTSKIKLTQFYGIEIDDFAHETAKLSLWLAEHQMNLAFKEVFGATRPTLPLQDGGNIVCGNATRLDWEKVCPKDEGYEIYILGNPPYLGARNQSKEQKNDVRTVLGSLKGVNSLDYISCWFSKAADYLSLTNHQCSFVTTNSICQGEQVGLFWPHIFQKDIEIGFAHQSFKWTNNAKGNAGVTCMVVGLRLHSQKNKYIYNSGFTRQVENISPYITGNRTIFVYKRRRPLSNIPLMAYGNQPIEGGFLKLSESEYETLLSDYPNTNAYIRKLIGGNEFLKDRKRWCIWIEDKDVNNALKIAPIKERVQKVKKFRIDGGEVARSLVDRSHQFRYRHEAQQSFILIPCTSSENRDYLPAGFFDKEYISLHSAQIIYDPPLWIFAMVSSRMHMTWVRAVAGRLKTDYRYSSALCYNTFPFPKISEAQKETLEEHVFAVLEAREQHSEKTMAQLYDPDKMPADLRQAHHEMDMAVERCYRKQPFNSDEERLEYLFTRYEKMIEAEKKQA